jgi:NAD(P)-dependent dehydrogenase (short-subunit alcohol dehydrogenase family)
MNPGHVDVRFPMRGRLAGKVAIITGGGAGIGAETARVLAAQSARVAVVDIVGEAAIQIAAEIAVAGGSAMALTADVSNESAVAAMVEAVISRFKRIDVLHNNAALTALDHMRADGAAAGIDCGHWDRTMAVNLRGPMLCCKHVIPHMIAGGGGSIINMGSGKGSQGDIVHTAYGTSKAAVTMFTKYVAAQYGKQGIRANSLTVGVVLKGEEILRRNLAPTRAAQLARYDDHHLTPYLGNPRQIADVVAFLASEESGFITGAEIPVDGGFTSHAPTIADMRPK